MSVATPEYIIPTDEMLSILKTEDLPVDTQPVSVTDDLLERRVAVATVYEHNDQLHSAGPVRIGRVALISEETNMVHIADHEMPEVSAATYVMPSEFHSPIAVNPQTPNFTQILPVKALFYILPQMRS